MAATATRPGIDASLWDKLGDTFNAVVEGSMGLVTRLLGGSAHERVVKQLGYVRPKGATQHTVLPGTLLDKVKPGQKIELILVEQGRDFVVTEVK